ncbi:MAG: hypothetical protein AAGA11_14890 [Pseudomonadota bacterium]
MTLKRICWWAVGLLLVGSAHATDWRTLDGDGISVALTDKTLRYAAATQTFYASGRTLYDAGRPSWGRWRVEGDRYCSVWPPAGDWACYDVAIHSDGTRVRFSGAGGNVSTGAYVD